MAYFPSPNITTSISSKNKLKLADLRDDKEKVFNNSRTKFIRPPELIKMDENKRQEVDTHNRREYLKRLGGVKTTNYSILEITNRLENGIKV